MRYLGIDFGLKHIGLAVNFGFLAEPLSQFSYQTISQALEKIDKICSREAIEQLVVGISENKMAEITKEFGETLSKTIKLPVIFQDETLTSKEAENNLIDSGISRKKRAAKGHQAAAALILQDFLDYQKKDLVE